MQAFFFKTQNIVFHHYKINEEGKIETTKFIITVKAVVIAFIIDKASAPLVLGIMGHSGYCSCWSCLIIGRKERREAVHFPFIGFDKKSARRTVEFAIECERLRVETNSDFYGGHKRLTKFIKLNQFNIFSIFVHDMFHNLILGILEDLIKQLISDSNAVSKSYKIKYTKEINKHSSKLKDFSHWKGVDKINFLLYSLIPILIISEKKDGEKYSDDFIKKWSKYVKYYSYLNEKDINKAPTLSTVWNSNKEIINQVKKTPNNEITSKAHGGCHSGSDMLNMVQFGMFLLFVLRVLLQKLNQQVEIVKLMLLLLLKIIFHLVLVSIILTQM